MAMHARSADLKQQIERSLAQRIPAALSPIATQAPRLLSTGIAEVDSLLNGGLPVGAVSEFTGMASSGRTGLAFAVLRMASVDSACAYIDVSNTLDPIYAAAAGITLRNLLWVRLAHTPGRADASKMPRVPKENDVLATRKQSHFRGFGAHPRTETKGIDQALEKMLRDKAEARLKKAEGTPGYPNRKLNMTTASLADANKDQIDYEHFNARRADETDPRRQSDQRAAVIARERARITGAASVAKYMQDKPWSRLDKALRATDQVLQSGGFRVVILDLASVLPEHALRIPSATWFRFRRAAQESDAILLVLTEQACAQSSAACVLECSSQNTGITDGNLFTGAMHTAEVARQRVASSFGKKAPGRATAWQATAPWMRSAGR
jgi:recombination protein RecA